MNAVCPKCASVDARSIVQVYREARRPRTPLAREAAPPRKRNVAAWLALTLVLAAAFVFELSSLGASTIVLGGLALTGGWMTQHVRAYNATDLPDLIKAMGAIGDVQPMRARLRTRRTADLAPAQPPMMSFVSAGVSP